MVYYTLQIRADYRQKPGQRLTVGIQSQKLKKRHERMVLTIYKVSVPPTCDTSQNFFPGNCTAHRKLYPLASNSDQVNDAVIVKCHSDGDIFQLRYGLGR